MINRERLAKDFAEMLEKPMMIEWEDSRLEARFNYPPKRDPSGLFKITDV